MIRRQAGDDFLLITQNDHAQVAAQLAGHFGNNRFSRPLPPRLAAAAALPQASVLLAVEMHDAGWPLHDDEPTLNERGLPLDVFETPRGIALPVWAASADRAEAADAYAGLLVSLHSLSLSIHASSGKVSTEEKFDVRKMQDVFAINKFQHREVERQEQIRQRLGFSTRVPLKHGLAEARVSEVEDRLRFDFRVLQAMDLISLCVCCAKLPQGEIKEVQRSPAHDGVKLRLTKNLAGVVRVDPWPFDVKQIEMQVPCRRVPGWRMESVEKFRKCYREAAVEKLTVRVEK